MHDTRMAKAIEHHRYDSGQTRIACLHNILVYKPIEIIIRCSEDTLGCGDFLMACGEEKESWCVAFKAVERLYTMVILMRYQWHMDS